MAAKGSNARFEWDGVSYTTEHCLQAWDFANSVNDIVYQCGGYDKHLGGTKNVSFNVSLALDATDTTKITALAPGDTTTQFSAHPAGATTNYIKITSTDGLVLSNNLTAPINGIVSMDVVIALNNVTITKA